MAEKTEKQVLGAIGEDIAVKYINNKGFRVITRNYLKKCGEIDIIAEKCKILHFIEVKSVSCEITSNLSDNVSRETDNYRPEDNIHPLKLKRLARTIEIYLFESYPKEVPEWQFDAITVKIDTTTHKAKIKLIENLIF